MIHPTPNRRLALAAISLTAVLAMPTAAQTIYEDFKLLPDDRADGDQLGHSVAISGNTAVIGAYSDDDNGNRSGSAYLFDSRTGHLISKLLASDGNSGDEFGKAVAISGTNVVVGAHWDDNEIGTAVGAVYVFDTITGKQTLKFVPKEAGAYDHFGYAAAISGEIAIGGSFFDNGFRGSAYLFNATTGEQIAKLTANDGAGYEYFGQSVAISDTIAAVGAHRHNDTGAVYLFDVTTGQQIAKLVAEDGAAGDYFGWSVAIYNTTLVVGASRAEVDGQWGNGAAYIFDMTTGEQVAKLLAGDADTVSLFGYSVAVNDTVAVIGDHRNYINGSNSGSAYVYDTQTGRMIARILPSDGISEDRFANSIAISGNTLITGAPLDDDNGSSSGSAYLFTAPSPCPPDLTNDGTLDSFDVSAFLTAYNAQDPTADFNADGSFNFFDVSAFVEAFLNGCP